MYSFIRVFFLALSVLMISVVSALAYPDFGAAPEIDPSMAPSAITLLTGGVLILRSKFRRK